MKKTHFLILIFLSLFDYVFGQDANLLKPRVRVSFTIYVAAPRKDCERGLGLCGTSETTIEARQVRAGWGIGDGSVHLVFRADELSSSLLDEFEMNSTFEVGNDIILRDNICQALELPNQTVLRAGNYPLKFDKYEYIVKIPLQ